ncbi:response regulator [Singulisphaera rosea]
MTARRLLIVEDDSISRRAMEALFRRQGWEVSSAKSVSEGLALLEPPPDCVVLDLMLPDGNGETILKRVRDAQLSSRVIVVTGCQDRARLDALAMLKPEAMLRKPLDFVQLCTLCK